MSSVHKKLLSKIESSLRRLLRAGLDDDPIAAKSMIASLLDEIEQAKGTE